VRRAYRPLYKTDQKLYRLLDRFRLVLKDNIKTNFREIQREGSGSFQLHQYRFRQQTCLKAVMRASIFAFCVHCDVISCVGRGLSDRLITRPEESYRVSNCVMERTSTGGLGKPQQ
jgi:hypothetical protein